eukprot:5902235-Amphidinium_carterae.1
MRAHAFLRLPGRSCAALAAETNTRGVSFPRSSDSDWTMVGSSAFEHLASQPVTDESLGMWLLALVQAVPGNPNAQDALSQIDVRLWVQEAYALRQRAESHVASQDMSDQASPITAGAALFGFVPPLPPGGS